MPIETIPGSELKYHLIAYDERGNERREGDGMLRSEAVAQILRDEPFTDIFVLSHGWQGDMPSARRQYSKWIGAMSACTADLEAVRQRPGGGFRPLLIGLHWPSLAWGDEELSSGAASFDIAEPAPIVGLVDDYAARLADTPAARAALETIFASAMNDMEPDELPPEVQEAYRTLDREAGLGSEGEGADPGADREPFDPEKTYQAAKEDVSFGIGDWFGGVLAPLRTLTFWKMKNRARDFGETGSFRLLQTIQQHTSKDVRIHCMGHSFGCIVVSATLAGPGGRGQHARPIHSLALIQGALSLWSYCSDIPFAKGRPGYFRSVVADRKVRGPIITTMSARDTAVGRFYPLGAGARGDLAFAPGTLPKYGGVGIFGARGPGLDIVDFEMQPADGRYTFEPGKIYNLESTRYISEGGGTSGAHNDIARPEVAHAFWSAVRAGQ